MIYGFVLCEFLIFGWDDNLAPYKARLYIQICSNPEKPDQLVQVDLIRFRAKLCRKVDLEVLS